MSINRRSHKKHRWFVDNYGTRRGALLTHGYRVLSFFGRYHVYRQIDWGTVDRLVFVCKGNVCRSAYAEAVAKSIGIDAISCGIDTTDGGPANELAVSISANRGVSLDQHKTTTVQSLTFRKNDLLLAMEPWQSEFLLKNLPLNTKCTLLGLWGAPVTPHIHDPYGSSPAYFNHCFNYIEKTVHEIAGKINKKNC